MLEGRGGGGHGKMQFKKNTQGVAAWGGHWQEDPMTLFASVLLSYLPGMLKQLLPRGLSADPPDVKRHVAKGGII